MRAHDKDVVIELIVFGPLMHPISIVHVSELEGVCDGEALIRAMSAAGDRSYLYCQRRDDQRHFAICRVFC